MEERGEAEISRWWLAGERSIVKIGNRKKLTEGIECVGRITACLSGWGEFIEGPESAANSRSRVSLVGRHASQSRHSLG